MSVNKEFLQFIYQAAGMQRWNDHIRPNKGFTELDKQAHKMVFAYIIGRFEEEDRKVDIDWQKIIEGGLFELLHRLLLTDIKPPVFHKLMSKKGDQLNTWVISKLEEKGVYRLHDSFRSKISEYYLNPQSNPLEKKILKASHYLATNWEFKIIYRLNRGFYGLDETKHSIANEIEDHYDLAGVQKIMLGKKTMDFVDLMGQLRFQQRWAQTPRLPETSVLGHMLLVALITYVFTLCAGGCRKRLYNNFFAALFHDIPEVLTRDIISPVKNAVSELDSIIKQIEENQVEENILPLLPVSWHSELLYFTRKEFSNKIIQNGSIIIKDVIESKYNSDEYSPLDGKLINGCDKLAALLEAYLSIKYGVSTQFLIDGYKGIYEKYCNVEIGEINLGSVVKLFKLNL